MNKLQLLKYIIIDVDGTMTDGGIYYDSYGNEIKKFCTKDAAGLFCLKAAGIQPLVVTGRRCFATERRMQDLRVEFLYQDVKDKKLFLEHFTKDYGVSAGEIGYLGDDLNDYAAMSLCGFKACPANACEEIKEISDYISARTGGNGAVRDVAEHILKGRKQWAEAIRSVYGVNDLHRMLGAGE
ncbi:MAG TPA: hypothetical protein DF613_01575 [Lachnospiraceae bacterium]|nr:hypothetical protein [Lachnospiraceae bacterium]